MLKCLLGLRRADSGAIRLDGKSLEAWKRPEIARRVGYLAQGAPCHWPMTAERIVALGVLPDAGRIDKAVLDARVAQAMERTGTTHLRARDVTSLSGGERSLVMIARCLAGGAPLLLADEPVTGLDPRHQIAVMRTLAARDNTHEGGGTGRVVVLHDLGLAARFCSRLVLLAEGRILADGPPRDVLTEANLADRLRDRRRRSAKSTGRWSSSIAKERVGISPPERLASGPCAMLCFARKITSHDMGRIPQYRLASPDRVCG